MLAYWGRHGALPQFTLELADACQRVGQIERTAISISTTNELFESYRRFGEAIFPLKTYQLAAGILDVTEFIKTRRAFGERLIADGTQGFVSLMSHVWSPLLMPILSKHGIRHTVIVHDADPHQGDRTAWVNRWLLREAAAADHVVTLTHAVAERLIASRRIPKDKITVLFHPDLNYSPQCIPQNRSAPLRVLFFGRILAYKGLDIFVDAIEALREAGVEVRVSVFGRGDLGRERQRLEALGAEVSNVWVDPKEISEILSKHDVVVVSHVQASQSGVIAAAHGAGLPVIATPVGGLTEQILPEITGLLAPGVTGAALATAIKRVADDRSLLQRMSRNIIATRTDRSMDRFLNDLTEIALGSGKRRS
jgi:glycosyltransferase involved in cell wall biosynthesis